MKNKYQKLQDKEWLVEQVKTRSLRKIALEVGCSYSAVVSILVTHGIDVKTVRSGISLLPRENTLESKMLPEKEKIISDFELGSIIASDLAKKYGVSKAAVWKVFRSWGVDTSKPHFSINKNALDRHKDEIVEAYSKDLVSARAIAARYGVSYKTARESLIRWGVLRRGRVSLNPFLRDKEWLRKKYEEEKMSVREIAELSGSTIGSVHSSLFWAGIKMRSIEESRNITQRPTGVDHHLFRGGRRKTKRGYVYILEPKHPFATTDGYVMEHRLVFEKSIGRYLTPSEVINHRNGLKDDNRIENLELVSDRGTHTRNHFGDSFKTRKLEEALRTLDPNHPLLTKD